MKKSHLSKLWFFAACAGLMALFIAAATLLNRQSAPTAAKFLLYQVFCMLLPGCALMKLLRFRCRNVVHLFGFSYATGYCLSVLTYIVAIPLSRLTGGWMRYIGLINIALGIASTAYLAGSLIFDARGFNRWLSRLERLSSADIWLALGAWTGVFVLYFLIFGLSNRLPGLGTKQAYYVDNLFWIGNAVALSRGFPPESIRGAGSTVYYHYFSSMQLVSMEKTIGLRLSTLGLAYSYIQSSIILCFGLYCLFESVFKSKGIRILAIILVVFSMGFYEQTANFISSHILAGPFGFDISLGLSAFSLSILFRNRRRQSIVWGDVTVYLLLLTICMGVKAPTGILLLGATGLYCLRGVFSTSKKKHALVLGIVSVILCACVYILFMANSNAWIVKSQSIPKGESSTTGGGFLFSMRGTADFSPTIKQIYSREYAGLSQGSRILLVIRVILEYIFLSNMALSFLCIWRIVKMLIHPKKNSCFVHWMCLILLIVALFLSLFVSMIGNSQGYFIQSAIIYAVILAFYDADTETPLSPTALSIRRIVLLPLLVACILNACIFNYPIVSDSINTLRTGDVMLTSRFNYNIVSSLVTPLEAEGYEWLYSMTDEDTILISNAMPNNLSPLMTGVFTERRMWLESKQSPSVDRKTADKRIYLVDEFYNAHSRGAYYAMRHDGVDYAIVLTRFETGEEYTDELPCVFANDDIKIYALHAVKDEV